MAYGIKRHHCAAHKRTPWNNLLQDHRIINSSILSTSKNIILVEKSPKNSFKPDSEKLTYDEAKSLCESFCRSIYFPSTLEENNELRLLLNDIKGQTYLYGIETWLRQIFSNDCHWLTTEDIIS